MREITRDRNGGRGWGGRLCHRPQWFYLTSMCHLTVLHIRRHVLPGAVRTYMLTAGVNLDFSSTVAAFNLRLLLTEGPNFCRFDRPVRLNLRSGHMFGWNSTKPCFTFILPQPSVFHYVCRSSSSTLLSCDTGKISFDETESVCVWGGGSLAFRKTLVRVGAGLELPLLTIIKLLMKPCNQKADTLLSCF